MQKLACDESAYLACVRTIRRESTWEETAEVISLHSSKARTVAWKGGGKRLLCEPMVDLSYQREGAGEVRRGLQMACEKQYTSKYIYYI